MLEHMPAGRGGRRAAGQGHRLRVSFSSTTGLCLAVYLATPQSGQFTVLQLVATDNNRYSLDHIFSLFSTQVRILLIGFVKYVWAYTVGGSSSGGRVVVCQPDAGSIPELHLAKCRGVPEQDTT